MANKAFYNVRGAGDKLGLTSERARQLFRDGTIPTTAQLNERTPLVDGETLKRVAATREAARQRRQRRA
jgi:hypothetical protein